MEHARLCKACACAWSLLILDVRLLLALRIPMIHIDTSTTAQLKPLCKYVFSEPDHVYLKYL